MIPVPFNQPLLASSSSPINGEIYNYGYQAQDTNGNPLTTEPDSTYDGGNAPPFSATPSTRSLTAHRESVHTMPCSFTLKGA